MKKSFLLACLFAGSVNATPITVTFSEEVVPTQTELDGTAYFSSYGIGFADSTTIVQHALFLEDRVGIYNSGSNNLMTVLWDSAITSLDFSWAIFADDIYADAYDSNGLLVDSFSALSAPTNGVGSLSGAGITKVTWHDGGSLIGLDSLTWEPASVPEPASIALLGLGLVGIGYSRKRKAA